MQKACADNAASQLLTRFWYNCDTRMFLLLLLLLQHLLLQLPHLAAWLQHDRLASCHSCYCSLAAATLPLHPAHSLRLHSSALLCTYVLQLLLLIWVQQVGLLLLLLLRWLLGLQRLPITILLLLMLLLML
jgi:hypothetical protein